jgi:hypothetical protein
MKTIKRFLISGYLVLAGLGSFGQGSKGPAPSHAGKVGIDTAAFNLKIKTMVNGDATGKWPVKGPKPLPGAILPFYRILAYYGNLYSTRMGILGEFDEATVLSKLMGEKAKWEKADPVMPVKPALHYIAVTAQGSAGSDGKYRLRMPDKEIDKVLAMANKIDAIVFLDIQVALSDLKSEIPRLEKYLMMPQVHLGIDPEFSMKGGQKPGAAVGTFDADDINYASRYLRDLVVKHQLPPKVLIVHRFTEKMVTRYRSIELKPEVQVVMHMDGWGEPAKKINTYKLFVAKQPVEYPGFKIFYKNDTKKVNRTQEMQPADLLKLQPRPLYIQYQ